MKIAITGSAGTGKSTLTQALAKHLDVVAIKENYEPLYDARVKGDFPPRLLTILEHKRSLENTSQRFVTDRCPIDLMHVWLNQSCHKINPALTNEFFAACLQQAKSYDFIIVTPWNSLRLEQNTEKLPRDMNIMEQLRHHASLLGHVHLWIPEAKIIEIPQAIHKLEERITFINQSIKKRRPELLQSAFSS